MSDSTDHKNKNPENQVVQPLSDNFEENLSRFIQDAADFGCIWGLQNDEFWVQLFYFRPPYDIISLRFIGVGPRNTNTAELLDVKYETRPIRR